MLLASLNAVCTLLADNSLSLVALAERLGSVAVEYKYNLLVQPEDSLFAVVNVARQPDRDEVAYVMLRLREPLEFESLVTVFGEYEPLPLMPGEPEQVIFVLQTAHTPHHVALIASLYEGLVHEITLRRD